MRAVPSITCLAPLLRAPRTFMSKKHPQPADEAVDVEAEQATDLPNREALSLIGGGGILGGPPTVYTGPDPVNAAPLPPESPLPPEPPAA